MTNQIIRVPRAPLSKPEGGLGIDWRHPFARGLVHSYPFNEGQGETCKNYVWPQGQFDLKFRVPNVADSPQWGTFFTVPGLQLDIDQTNPLDQAQGNTGTTNPNGTGANLLPAIDFSKGFTAHLWMRPTESQVGVVTSYNLLNLGPVNEAVRVVFMIHLTRFAASGTDWWRRNITVYSDGSSSVNLTSSDEVWEAPFIGGRVKIDSLPFEHVISVPANSASGEVKWYSSDGYSFGFAGVGPITPPDNNQYWPIFNVSGQPPFEGHVWAINIYNYAMGPEAAFALMRNPLQMYLSRPGGGYGADVVPPGTNFPVVTLAANPAAISAGYPSTLTWTSQFADTLVIDNGIGSVVVPNGSTIVFPNVTTTYTITAANDFGSTQAQATVTVTPRGQGRPVGVSAGALLQRDLTRASDAGLGPTDNGVAYPAFVTIGSVVLTHPSELALVLFLTTEALAIGSHPNVSVLLDEVASSIAVPFASLGAFVPDTPVLVAAQTLFSDRFYISQTQLPAVCRHMQVKVTWPTEIAANELLTWSVIGANVEER